MLSSEVVLCTYNGAEFIVEQLCSILNQTVPVDRISILDDGSTDATLKKLATFVAQQVSKTRTKIAITRNPANLGYARNFASGLLQSREDIVFLCDQDDIWEPYKVEQMLDAFKDDDVGLVFSDGYIVDRNGSLASERSVLEWYGLSTLDIEQFSENSFDWLVRRNYVNGAAAAIRRSVALDSLPLPCDMPHDYWLALWASLSSRVVALPAKLYSYRQHQHNAIGMGDSKLLYRWLGIWRSPRYPRERELMIMESIVPRIVATFGHDKVAPAVAKLAWLQSILSNDSSRFQRLVLILGSVLYGRYGRFANEDAMFRDIVSLLR